MRFIPESTRAVAGERHFDLAGALSVTAGLVLLTFAIVRTDVNGWTSAATLGSPGRASRCWRSSSSSSAARRDRSSR